MGDGSLWYETLIAPIHDRIIRSIWRITRNAQDAEDALQNSLVVIWGHRQRIAHHKTPPILVIKICLDSAYDVVRKRFRDHRRLETAEFAASIEDGSSRPVEELVQRELTDELIAAISRLSRSQAVAIALRAFEESSYDQIAAAMNCTEATARKHVERARARLQVVLSKHQTSRIYGS